MSGRRPVPVVVSLVLLVVLLYLPAPSFSFRATGNVPEVGEEARDFSLPDTKGRETRLSDFRGKVILLSFWSCYTDKCFTSVRIIKELLEEFHGQGLVAPTVCSEIPEAFIRNNYEELLKRCGLGQVVMVDEEKDVKRTYKVRRLPSSYLIGPDFTIREIIGGVARLREPGFRDAVASLLAELPPDAKEREE